MAMRKRLSRKANKKNFRRVAAKVHVKNLSKYHGRGGYCL